MRSSTLVQRGNAFCFPQQRFDVVRVPDSEDQQTERDIKHIPDIELAEAVARFVADARSERARNCTNEPLRSSAGSATVRQSSLNSPVRSTGWSPSSE